MSVLSIAKRVCLKIGLNQPDTLATNTEREYVELFSTFNSVARKIVDKYDWQILKELATLTGNGVNEDFPLPVTYRRMLKKAKIWPSNQPNIPLDHIIDTDVWLRNVITNTQPLYPQWTIYGGQIHVRPALANGATAKFFHIKKAITVDLKEEFTSDNDVFIIDEELLRLAVISEWKSDKGLPYGEDMAATEEAFSILVGADKGSKILEVGKKRSHYDSDVAFPRALGR
jgi:hypothetical protein